MSGSLRLMTLNISGPSMGRAQRLLEYLCEIDPDIVVLTETRANAGTGFLLESFQDAGYEVEAPMSASNGERGVAILHRVADSSVVSSTDPVDLSHRLVSLLIGSRPTLTLMGVYVPSRDASPDKVLRKQTFVEQMTERVRGVAKERDLILMGDLNVIGRNHYPKYSNFRAWEYDLLDQIASVGLVDVFKELNPGVQAHSWIGRKGAGYRYDYVFVSESLSAHVQGCEYLHEPRERGITDHAALQMTIGAATATRDVRAPNVGHQLVMTTG
jgi:exodeoxyribonuclease III